MSEAGEDTERRQDKPGSIKADAEPESAQVASQSQQGFLGSWLGSSAAPASAWGLWESVKNNPRVVEAQQQAQQAWQNYDSEVVRARLVDLGKTATTYLDEADRRLETLEVNAVSYLQQRGTELAEKVRAVAAAPEHEGEVLFSGPERTPMSRFDAELQALHTSPEQIRAKTDAPVAILSSARTEELLSGSPELVKLHSKLAPELGETEFWNRYLALRDELEKQDHRRKMLIETQSDEKFEGWGSSDEEGDEVTPNDAHPPAAKTREPIEEEASDIDWE